MDAFDAIIGYEDVKDKLRRTADFLRNVDEYRKLGVRPSRALLLYGEPGVGKSLMARCLIEESGRAVYTCRKDAPNGAFVENIKKTFTEAMQHCPSIVFLDDLDKFANEDERHRDAEEYVTVQSCIDALGDAEVFVLATANDIEKLPQSLLRQGRLGNRLRVVCPEGEDGEQIIRHYLRTKSCVDDIDEMLLARLLGGHSCAELEEVVNEAGLLAGYRRNACIAMDDLVHAALALVFGITDWVDKPSDQTDEQELQVAYHEAGHVVVGEVLDPGSTTMATTLKGKDGNRGLVLSKSSECFESFARREFSILMGLGGRAAVEWEFGIVDIGSLDDTLKVTSIIERQVCGDGCCGAVFLRRRFASRSDAWENNVEQVIAAILERYYSKTKEILAKNAGLLEAVAKRLIDRRIITMSDIKELRREHPITAVRW